MNGAGTLLTEDIEKGEILKVFITSVFRSKTSLQKDSTDAEAREKIWNKEDILLQEDQFREYLSKLVIFKSISPHGMHSNAKGAD